MKKFKIGHIEISNNLILAPMAGVTDLAFRRICKDFGVGLVCAEMVSIDGIVHKNEKSLNMLKVDKYERPLSMQIFGNNLSSYVKATQYVEQNCECDIIDINMGCPAPKVAERSQAGASLLKDPNKIGEIVRSVVINTSKPVTVKLRIGWDVNNINVVEVAKICEQNGASALTIHGRTRSQYFSGKSDWSWISKVKDSVKIPVIGNGDIINEITAKDMFEKTNCDAIMIARAAQGNPWIFQEIDTFLLTGKYTKKPTPKEVIDIIVKHVGILIKEKGELRGVREMRKQIVWYLKNIPKELKSQDINQKAVEVSTKNDIIKLLEINIRK
ncbi:tRNA dihydrouridine synthase DusB [Spiroplasma endosymbiont of Aspidapion aeneum]|uniref:tRNA dihydrouridine synthase DusB n=1 Tax=Spiroplasma endosymbiont of Aspidapion aeneum TaxID=3066276 RepID=UPI00313BCA67